MKTDKYDLKELIKYLCDEMRGYGDVRTGGNIGTAINGMLIGNALIEVSKSIDGLTSKLNQVLMKLEEKKEENKI